MINFLKDIIIIDGYSCKSTEFFPIYQALKFVIVIIQIAVPFALVIWGSLDFFKALIAHDEKEMRIKRKPFIQRLIAALIIFFLPWFVQFVSEQLAGKEDSNNFWKCYSEAKARLDFSSWRDGIKIDTDDDDDDKSSDGNKTQEFKPLSNPVSCTSYKTSKTCKRDDYGNVCEWYVAKKTKTKKTYKCRVKTEKTACTDYSSKGSITCNKSRDSEGNQCLWSTQTERCLPKVDRLTCEDYKSESECKANDSRDDYGNKCKWDRVLQVNSNSNNPQYTYKCLTK